VRTTEGTRKTVGTYPTQDAATVAWWDARSKHQAGKWTDPAKGNVCFSDWALEYLELSAKDLGAGTLRNYHTIVNKRLIPTFGSKPVNKVSRVDVRRWWATMPATQNSRNVCSCFRALMREAVELGLIEDNPVQAPKAGKDMSKPRPEHPVEGFTAVLGHMPHIYQVPAWTLFAAHLRVSELAGLNRGDFDPETGQLTVERQDSEIGGHHLKATKTGQRRSLAVLEPGASMLAKYHKAGLVRLTPPCSDRREHGSRHVSSASSGTRRAYSPKSTTSTFVT
jgi:integrase